MQQWLITLGTQHAIWVYALIAILACVEGPILSLIFGALIKLGFFGFFPVYFALMAGDLIGDVVWYNIGRFWGHPFIRKFGKYFSITEEAVTKVTKIFRKYTDSILFVSKISNGLGFAIVTLMTAGMTRIPFWRYIIINVLGQFVWTGILISVGYFLGRLYTQAGNILEYISVTALAIVVIAAFFGFKRYLKRRAEEMEV